MPTEQIKGKVPLIGAAIVFLVAVVVLPYQMLKLKSLQKELDKREKWMNNVQELLLESNEGSVKPVLPKDQ